MNGKISLTSLLGLLPVVGPVVAALPQFKAIYDELTATFSSHSDQKTLKDAYAVAVSGAADAHNDLQDIITRNS